MGTDQAEQATDDAVSLARKPKVATHTGMRAMAKETGIVSLILGSKQPMSKHRVM